MARDRRPLPALPLFGAFVGAAVAAGFTNVIVHGIATSSFDVDLDVGLGVVAGTSAAAPLVVAVALWGVSRLTGRRTARVGVFWSAVVVLVVAALLAGSASTGGATATLVVMDLLVAIYVLPTIMLPKF